MYHITMKDHNTPDKPKYFLKRDQSGETEQQRLEREVLAAGGRVGRSEGRFIFGFHYGEVYRIGDEHSEVKGLYFCRKEKESANLYWLDKDRFSEFQERRRANELSWARNNPKKVAKKSKRWREKNKEAKKNENK